MRIDEIDRRQVPARITHVQALEMAITRGHLVAPALEAEGAGGYAVGGGSLRREKRGAGRHCWGFRAQPQALGDSAAALKQPSSLWCAR